jgi:hypothetical protein
MLTTPTTWECNVETAAVHGEAYIVQDYPFSSSDYEAWGEIDGELFCCAIDARPEGPLGPVLTNINIRGGPAPDTLAFHYVVGVFPFAAYDLHSATGSPVQGLIMGLDGVDTITGSNDSAGTGIYSETLLGGEGNDTIFGLAGVDNILGEGGVDTLSGGQGIDYIYGGAGGDIIDGGPGADVIYGDGGLTVGDADTITGGAGSDTIYGQDGGDTISGNLGDDTIYGDLVG